MATKPRNKDARPVFRSLEEIFEHFQPKRAKEDKREENPFAELNSTFTRDGFRRVQAELENARRELRDA
jgi:hypothetical protein